MELRPIEILVVEDGNGEEEHALMLRDFRIVVDEDGGMTVVRPLSRDEYDEILETMTHEVKKMTDAN